VEGGGQGKCKLKVCFQGKMKTKFTIFCLFLLIILFKLNAYGAMKCYLVVFEEGYYEEEEDQLYRAKVTVYQGDKKLKTKEEIRGSTLPNRFLYRLDKNRPIIASGEYKFDVKSSDKFSKALRLSEGGFIDTINPNPRNHNHYIANGIWVHKGSKGPIRGSEGCITIDPKNWDEFIKLFPYAEDWKKKDYQGKIIITRDSDRSFNQPSSPSNLRIRKHTLVKRKCY
jgi:hypothetical protein